MSFPGGPEDPGAEASDSEDSDSEDSGTGEALVDEAVLLPELVKGPEEVPIWPIASHDTKTSNAPSSMILIIIKLILFFIECSRNAPKP